ncbi:MAG TPA: alpha/beta hydrolase-fold protein [Caulobacteraceae bacterium]|nr:alpha/beta hydrolase-fold protein [Caulobacteraceae bacterium]
MTVAERLADHVHPLVASLRDGAVGEAAFWAQVDQLRTPLIEPHPTSTGRSIVTYVFPAPPEARHVVVQSGVGDAPRNVMDRIAGTSVCHASYSYRDDARTSYSFAPDMPLISFDDATEAELKQLHAFWEGFTPAPDPHGREVFVSRAGEGRPDDHTSFVSLPQAPDDQLACKRPDIARGWIDRLALRSELMGNERNIWVYTPPGYASGDQVYPLLLAFDGGWALTRVPTQRLLDNLLADGRIKPVVAVFIDNPTPDSRNLELPCNESFARFVEEELLPWLRGRYRISDSPADHFVTGASYGGLAAMWFGYRLPHLFGNVISQAASLWWGPGFRMDVPRSAGGYPPEWLIEQYRASPRLPVRFWMEIGLMEHPSLMIEPNRRMKALLEEKGYDLTYSEPCGGHDTALWRGTLGSALAKMLAPAS